MLRTTMHWRIRYFRVNGSMLPTLVRNFLVHKGSQWVMYNASDVIGVSRVGIQWGMC